MSAAQQAGRPLRWALIGASDIAATRMVPAMRAVGGRPVVVQSSSSSRAQEFAQTNGVTRWTTDVSQAVTGDDVDAVYISSTNDRHCQQTLEALAAGKHVLCEKPIGISAEQGVTMVRAAASAQRVLATNHHLRCSGVHRRARRAVLEGAIGDLLAVRVAHAVLLPPRLRGWRLDAGAKGAGVVLDVTVHDADTVRFLTGQEFVAVSGVGSQSGGGAQAVTAVAVSGLLSGGALVQTLDAFTVGHAQTGVELHGTRGSLISTGSMTQDPVGSLHLRRDGEVTALEPEDGRDLYQVGLSRFADAVAGVGEPAAGALDGLASLLVGLAVESSLQTQSRVDVPSASASVARAGS